MPPRPTCRRSASCGPERRRSAPPPTGAEPLHPWRVLPLRWCVEGIVGPGARIGQRASGAGFTDRRVPHNNRTAELRPETIPSVATIDPTETTTTAGGRSAAITRRIAATARRPSAARCVGVEKSAAARKSEASVRAPAAEEPRIWSWSCFMPAWMVAAFWICSGVRMSTLPDARGPFAVDRFRSRPLVMVHRRQARGVRHGCAGDARGSLTARSRHPSGLRIPLRPAPRDAERARPFRGETRGRLHSGWNDDHEAHLLAELRRFLLRRDQEVQAEALDGPPAVLGPVPAEPLDPHPRAVGNERRVHCHDAGARLSLGERRGQPVVELPVFRAAGDVARHREAPPPGLHPEEGRLLGRGEDALVAARHGGERAARALRAPPTVTEVARERRRVAALRARHRGEPHARNQQTPCARRAPPACNTKPRAVVPEPLQLERIDDDGGSPVVAHGMARLLDGTRYQATAMPGANLRGRGGRRSSV